jgi:tetratricopeptide (TPR) repeat protein
MAASQQQFQQRLEQITRKLQLGNAQSAIHDIQSLPNNLLQHPNIQHLYALALKSLYQYPEALKIMQAIVSRYPKQPEFHNNLANLLKDMGEGESAVNHYKLALSLNPNYIDAFKNWLILTLDKADLVQAKHVIDKYRSRFLHSVVYQKYEADYLYKIICFEWL